MFKISLSDCIGLAGIVLAIVLVILDKADKLKGGWLYGLLVLAAVMTLFIAVGNTWVMDAPQKWKAWRAIFMLCVVALGYSGVAIWIAPSGSEVAKKETEKRLSYSVQVRSAFVSDSGPPTFYMILFPSSLGNTVSPVFYLAYLQIMNNDDQPVTIESVKIAASKDEVGPFEDLTNLPLDSVGLRALGIPTPCPKRLETGYGTLRLAKALTKDDMKHTAVVKAAATLQSQLGIPIPPHSPIKGWVGLDSPRKAGLTPGVIFFRLQIRDAQGRTEQYVTELPRKQPGDEPVEADTGTLEVLGRGEDISGFAIHYYSDPFPRP